MAIDFRGVDYSQGSAVDIIRSILAPYGLGGLAQGMYDVGKQTGSADASYLWLRDQDQYKQQFPGMAMRAQNGLAPIDEETYNQWKSQMTATMRQNGIPSGFYDSPDDFANFIGRDISAKEVEDRVVNGIVAARQAPQDVKDSLLNFYGIDEGHLAAYWLDPSPQKGEQLLRQQAATYMGAAAKRGGFQGLTATEAEGLGAEHQDPGQVEQRFSELTHSSELLNPLAGEDLSQMTREEQLQYARGSDQAKAELARRANMRKSQFGGGGGYAESQQGVAGLGTQ